MAYEASSSFLRFLQADLGGSPPETAFPAAQQGLSTLLYDSGAGEFWKTISDGGVLAWEALGGAGSSTVVSYDYYVSPTGDDKADGTINTPLATLDEALLRVGSVPWETYAHIHILGTLNVGANKTFTVPEPRLPLAEPVLIIGSWVDSGNGTITAGGGTAGASTGVGMSPGTITGLSIAGQRGARIRWLTGANAGGVRWSVTSSSTVVTSHRLWASTPLAGDTFVLEVPGASLQYTGNLVFEGTGAFVNGLTFLSSAPQTLIFAGDFTLNGTWFLATGGSVALTRRVALQGDIFPTPTLTVDPLGVFFNGSAVAMPDGSVVTMRGSYLRSSNIRPDTGSTVTVRQSYADENFAFVVRQASVSVDQLLVSAPTTNGSGVTAVLQFERGSNAAVSDVSISGIVGSADHMSISDGTSLTVTSYVIGSGGSGVGLRAMRGSTATVTGANTTVTIAGGGGAVKVGANAVTTWLLIAGGLTADVSDQGAASTQRVWVGP